MINEHLNIPSPLHAIETDWSRDMGIELLLKRDDLIHPIISGNKWRKLSGILGHYPSESFDTITTYGGAYSNHLLATAAACAIIGVRSVGVVRGERQEPLNAVLKLCEIYGMDLQFTDRTSFKDRKHTEGIQNKVLHIPEGGAAEQGWFGCSEILAEQGKEVEFADQIWVSCGTGTTYAGMYRYLERHQQSNKLIGVQVLKGDGYIARDVERLFGIGDARILDQYHHGGYAKTSDDLLDFAHDFTKQTGVMLDPIYTVKMMWAIRAEAGAGKIKRGERVIALHTGGLTGWFGK